MDPAWRNFKNICFTICTWPNRPVGAKILPGFQIEGKTDVWISHVRRVNQKPIICQKYVSCMYLPQETIQIATHDS